MTPMGAGKAGNPDPDGYTDNGVPVFVGTGTQPKPVAIAHRRLPPIVTGDIRGLHACCDVKYSRIVAESRRC